MGQSFSLYLARASGYHRLHPLTRAAFTGLILIGGLVLPGIWPVYAAFGALVVPLALWGRLLGPLLRAVWPVVLPFAISLFLIQGILWPGGTPVLGWGFFSFKAEGLRFAAASTGRVLLVVSGFVLLALGTRPDELMIALVERGLPGSIAYIVITTIQIVPRFQAKAASILDAQRARGLETEGRLLRRARALMPLIIPLILGSLVDIEERAVALEARGFSRRGPKTSLIALADSPRQRVFRWLAVLAMVGLVVARVVLAVAR